MSSIVPKNELENVNFFTSLLGQNFFVRFLGELKKSKSPFENNWPLVYTPGLLEGCRFWQINYQLSPAHYSYLDIYISQKIRFCVVDLEGKFQTNLQAKLLNFLVWKFRSIICTHFSSIFCRSCQIQCFLHTVAAILRWSIHVSRIYASNHNWNISTLWNSSDSVEKTLNLTNPTKNRRKLSIIDLNFQTKKLRSLACGFIWNLPSKSTTQNLIFSWM